jgi:hypothetical protein
LLCELVGLLRRGDAIHQIGSLVFGLGRGFESRGEFSRRLSHCRRSMWSEEFEARKRQTGHDPDKNAELD